MTDPEKLDPPEWAFSESELAAGLRRHTGDPTLIVTNISEREVTQRLPAVGHLRGLQVKTDSANGSQSFDLVLKEPHGSTRTGGPGAGVREVSIYLTLKEHLPARLPTLIAAHPKGEWLIMLHFAPGHRPDKWQAADYLLAADQLAILHDRFWALDDILSTYSWLESPLAAHRDLHLQDAMTNAEKLSSSNSPLLSQQTSIPELTETIIQHADEIVDHLSELPATLLHGDYWPGNINIHPTHGMTVFDWEDAAIGPAILDLLSFIQGSTWHFSPLPLSPEEIITHYLNRLKIVGGRTLPKKAFDAQWDYAVMWTFINGWVRTLANLPEVILNMRLEALQNVLFIPLQAAVRRRL